MQPAHSNPGLPEVCKPAPSAVKWEWQPDAEFLWFLPHRRNSPGCFSLATAAIFSASGLLDDERPLPLPAAPIDLSDGSGLPPQNRFCRHNRALARLSGVARAGELVTIPFSDFWGRRTTSRQGRFY